MHQRLAELHAYLAEERAGLLAILDTISHDSRDTRPAADEWSAAEVIEHLAIVERGVARVVAKRVAKARAEGHPLETDTSSVLHSLDATDIRDSGERRAAPQIVMPTGSLSAADATRGLAASRQQLEEAIALADGLALAEIRHTHLALGEIDLYQWILFVGMHEGRHAKQLQRISAMLAAGQGSQTLPGLHA